MGGGNGGLEFDGLGFEFTVSIEMEFVRREGGGGELKLVRISDVKIGDVEMLWFCR